MQTELERLVVLVVDPNRHMRTLINGILRALGVQRILEAADTADALKELRHTVVDVVLTEYATAPINGSEFTRMVRSATDIDNRMVPVIMLTGYTERHIVTEARDCGINEFLAKPISAEALYARLTAIVYRPRPFVRTKHYFGPDRRRRATENYHGPKRRSADDTPADDTPAQEGKPHHAD